jgi:predicted component of type VI protein secretion system
VVADMEQANEIKRETSQDAEVHLMSEEIEAAIREFISRIQELETRLPLIDE